MAFQQYMNRETAERVAGLEPGDVHAIIKLAALGLKPPQIEEVASEIADGREPSAKPANGRAGRIVINPWSFVKDYGQYHGVYGLSSEQAGRLLDLMMHDQDEAVKQIKEIADAKLTQNGSTKVAFVDPSMIPAKAGTSAVGPPSNDGGLAALKEIIKERPHVYGSYKFVAQPTGLGGVLTYGVDLGGSLVAMGQSKALAVAAARLCSQLGRHDNIVEPYIYGYEDGRDPLPPGRIPKQFWDGRRGSAEAPPPPMAKRAKTATPAAPAQASASGSGSQSASGSSSKAASGAAQAG
uniref:Capsid protein n=1 Tax=Phyllosticta capitalensis polymycovirus 2 TaxID=3367396 RepID=A0AB74UJU9_9VIRU